MERSEKISKTLKSDKIFKMAKHSKSFFLFKKNSLFPKKSKTPFLLFCVESIASLSSAVRKNTSMKNKEPEACFLSQYISGT